MNEVSLQKIGIAAVVVLAAACAGADDASSADSNAAAADSAPALPDALHSMREIGRLTDADGDAWVLVAGVECTGCDAPETVYLTRAGETELVAGPYGHPGEYAEMGVDEAPHARVRVLFGDCLAEPGDEAVWLVERDGGGAAWTRSAFVVRPGVSPADIPVAWDEELNTQLTLATECDEVPPRPQFAPRGTPE